MLGVLEETIEMGRSHFFRDVWCVWRLKLLQWQVWMDAKEIY